MNSFQELVDPSCNLGALAVNLADRGSAYAFELDLDSPEQIRSVEQRMHRAGWPVKHDPITGTIALDDDSFDAEHGDYLFVDRNNVRCDCSGLRQHLRHLIDQSKSYRRLVIQDSIMPILRRVMARPELGN